LCRLHGHTLRIPESFNFIPGGGLGVRGGGRAGIDWSDDDAHQASSGSRASNDARHDIDARATQDFKEASDYFTSRKVSESGSHTDNNADSRVDQLSAALNSAKQSYDQYTTNMTRSHEYAEMASRTESMSGQMSEDLSQQFAQYVMKHAPQDAEAILTNTSSPEIAERRRAMAWSFVQEQIQPGVDNAWRESRGDIGKGMESVPSGGGSQDIIADHQGHQAIITTTFNLPFNLFDSRFCIIYFFFHHKFPLIFLMIHADRSCGCNIFQTPKSIPQLPPQKTQQKQKR
jgi:conjugal transfer mating pair stabilization protein TraG